MFCTESNQHGQNFLNACLVRIEKLGEKNVHDDKNVFYTEGKKEEDLTGDYSLTDEGDVSEFFSFF